MSEGMRRDIAEKGTILRAIIGSKLHGLNLAGTDDTDEMGVCIEPPEYAIGLRTFEHFIFRTQPEGSPSGPGDLDLSIYGLRKYVRLALGGNPSILLLLFAPPQACSVRKVEGKELQALAPAFIARSVASPFLGYLTAQKQRLVGERGGRALRKSWAFEVAGSPYDTKYAMHMIRLGIQGVELLSTGRITLPMPEPGRSFVMAIRRGEVDINDVLTRTGELEQQLADLKTSAPLPEVPDAARVEDWMLRTYLTDKAWM